MMNGTESILSKADASFATDKNTTVTGVTVASSTDSMKAVHSDDEKSVEDFNPDSIDDVPESTPPLRIHATRVPERLSGSTLSIPSTLHNSMKRRLGSSNTSARSGSRTPSSYDGGSSISSLEDAGFDTDILTDKMGFLELDASSQKFENSSSHGVHLQTVAERLSEETLDDCHAFTGITVSRGGSIATGGEVSSNMLEPLDECDDEDEVEDRKIKITNMEDIQEDAEER